MHHALKPRKLIRVGHAMVITDHIRTISSLLQGDCAFHLYSIKTRIPIGTRASVDSTVVADAISTETEMTSYFHSAKVTQTRRIS